MDERRSADPRQGYLAIENYRKKFLEKALFTSKYQLGNLKICAAPRIDRTSLLHLSVDEGQMHDPAFIQSNQNVYSLLKMLPLSRKLAAIPTIPETYRECLKQAIISDLVDEYMVFSQDKWTGKWDKERLITGLEIFNSFMSWNWFSYRDQAASKALALDLILRYKAFIKRMPQARDIFPSRRLRILKTVINEKLNHILQNIFGLQKLEWIEKYGKHKMEMDGMDREDVIKFLRNPQKWEDVAQNNWSVKPRVFLDSELADVHSKVHLSTVNMTKNIFRTHEERLRVLEALKPTKQESQKAVSKKFVQYEMEEKKQFEEEKQIDNSQRDDAVREIERDALKRGSEDPYALLTDTRNRLNALGFKIHDIISELIPEKISIEEVKVKILAKTPEQIMNSSSAPVPYFKVVYKFYEKVNGDELKQVAEYFRYYRVSKDKDQEAYLRRQAERHTLLLTSRNKVKDIEKKMNALPQDVPASEIMRDVFDQFYKLGIKIQNVKTWLAPDKDGRISVDSFQNQLGQTLYQAKTIFEVYVKDVSEKLIRFARFERTLFCSAKDAEEAKDKLFNSANSLASTCIANAAQIPIKTYKINNKLIKM